LRESLLFETQDAFGPIQVFQKGQERFMTFGNAIRQTSLNQHRPQEPVFDYLKKMLISLALVPVPQKILVLGLGAGSLVTTLAHFEPQAEIHVVEHRPALIAIAQDYFNLPASPRLYAQDALTFLQETPENFDLIFTDLFSATGMAPCLQYPDFFTLARERLNPNGTHCINLWASQPYHYAQVKALMSMVHEHVLYEKDSFTTNVVAFALHPDEPPRSAGFTQRVKQLEQRLGFALR
jgi:spermidine synthase